MTKVRLADIALKVSSGLTPNRSNKEFWQNGIIDWVKTEQIGDRYIFSSTEKISLEALKRTSIKLNPINTISIAMYGEGKTRGSVSILKNEMTTNQACCNIIVDEKKADVDFIYYKLRTQYDNLRALSSGVRKNLNSNDIKEFEITIPSLAIQKKIASVLSTLDDKIELNNKINSELEAMAKTLYDYWFVQFDFPDANGKPYKSSGGKMVWNEALKRDIPEGWEVKTLYSIADYINGLACQKFRPVSETDDFLPVIKIREMNDGITSNTEKVRANIPEKYIIDDGDILFSWSATLDVKIWTQGKGGLNQHIFKVTSSKYPKTFYYYELLNYLQHFKMMAELRKTTMGHITIDHLKSSFISIPPLSLIYKLDEMLLPIVNKIISNQKQNQQLAQLRDWLLPLLMNGQVTVGEAEEKIGMVAEEAVEHVNH